MNIIYEGKLRRLGFTIAHADVLEAPVEAIVNSEETGFRLARNPNSLSGQIRMRYGENVQAELDQITRGEVQRPGTVLVTGGGDDFKYIFHAGFHDPADWPGRPGCSDEADYFQAIRACVAETLRLAQARQVASLAFPLLGCGAFGLSVHLLLQQFLDTLDQYDLTLAEGAELQVWLVIRDEAQMREVIQQFIAFTLGDRCRTVSLVLPSTKVAPLDRFGAVLQRRHPEDWAKWQLCRYAEVALEIMCYGLSRAAKISDPEEVLPEGEPATFGLVHEQARKAASADLDPTIWGARFFAGVISREDCAHALRSVRHERNNLAHGRKSISLGELETNCYVGLQLADWSRIPEMDGSLDLSQWKPWIVRRDSELTGAPREGLLERCQESVLRYVIPETGEMFALPKRINLPAALSVPR
ncbi:macro domain-containing protein [Horticoccus luteus]|uniref:Macro domain-containing protein n=1 Tax=Horticoccus luteus TaxID=2862869 RepID=A0A8F9XK81_9BACT|nr:macro domain-containing protein [Horticoccus luteus]QYM77814.1 macro domain-containing protein [Horticoccus luteus]